MSLKMVPFDRPHTTMVHYCKYSYYLVLFLSSLTLNYIVTLKSCLDVTQDHSNWYHLKDWFPMHLP